MCGIVGYVGSKPTVPILIGGLKRLEYRGYDSSGIAIFLDQKIQIVKAEGRLKHVETKLEPMAVQLKSATCGIGHTRWATHGKPNTINAHPHRAGHVALVHNGIIENYLELKRELLGRGHKPVSDTDSELFGFLVLEQMDSGKSLLDAVRTSFLKIQGQSSVLVMSEKEPHVLVGARLGSPLVIAKDPEGGAFFASDSQPLGAWNREVVYLEQGDLVLGNTHGCQFFDLRSGKSIERPITLINWSETQHVKGAYEHFMLKEIHEQPQVLVETFSALIDRKSDHPFTFQQQNGLQLLAEADELIIVACGSSWHAALLGKYWLERWAQISVSVELASEFRYRRPVLRSRAVVLGISQSGETADSLAVLRDSKQKGFATVAITNTRGSTISREVDAVFYTCAGTEVGVAASKTFLAQLLVLILIAGHLGMRRSAVDKDELSKLYHDLIRLPYLLESELDPGSKFINHLEKTAQALQLRRGFFFIGRGYSYPIALEGALKLKEIAYLFSEGYAAGELKHGPIAMIDDGMAVVVLAPRDAWHDKTVSNLEEVKARGAMIVGIGDSDDNDLKGLCDQWVPLPSGNRLIDTSLLPFIITPALQLLSYSLARQKGTDIDKPRNLAKSVTVE